MRRSRFVGARIVSADRRDGDLVVRLADVRRVGLRFKAAILFRNVEAMNGVDPRSPSTPPVLRAGATVTAWSREGGEVIVETFYPTGPGDADMARFVIACGAVHVSLRPSLRGTLKAWSRI